MIELNVGHFYKVKHQRKGEFIGKLSRIGKSYSDFRFISGEFAGNPKQGQLINVQVAFCKINEIEGNKDGE